MARMYSGRAELASTATIWVPQPASQPQRSGRAASVEQHDAVVRLVEPVRIAARQVQRLRV